MSVQWNIIFPNLSQPCQNIKSEVFKAGPDSFPQEIIILYKNIQNNSLVLHSSENFHFIQGLQENGSMLANEINASPLENKHLQR